MAKKTVKTTEGGDLKNPYIVRFLFNDPRMAAFWLIIRVLVGLKWFELAEFKLTTSAWWDSGIIVRSFWENQLAGVDPTTGQSVMIYPWYRDFLQSLLDAEAYTWMAKVIAIAELSVAIMLITGTLVGFAALAGMFLEFNYLLAGSAGNNALLFPAMVGLLAAWKIAGYYGLDYFIIRHVGSLWSPKPGEVNGSDRQLQQGTA